jgi:hypothetical protein
VAAFTTLAENFLPQLISLPKVCPSIRHWDATNRRACAAAAVACKDLEGGGWLSGETREEPWPARTWRGVAGSAERPGGRKLVLFWAAAPGVPPLTRLRVAKATCLA